MPIVQTYTLKQDLKNGRILQMVEINFKGKQYIYSHHHSVPFKELKIDVDKSHTQNVPSLDDNLIINGDNLHALKALLPKYASKIDCIYIDPPYNTGNEGWCYNDNVKAPIIQEWLKKEANPVDKEDMERHDKWLCMMYPRLKLLHELLSDTGVIFISIDDNEVHHLRMIMDEIFGGENYIETFIWHSRLGKGATSINTARLHEYVLCYSKNKTNLILEEDIRVSSKDAREKLRQWGQGDKREDRPSMYYPIKSEMFGDVYPIKADGTEGRWRVGQETALGFLKENRLIFEKQTDGRIEVYKKIPEGNVTKTAISSILDSSVVKTTAYGTTIIQNIFGEKIFSYSKPNELIKFLLKQSTSPNAIILDSFAGSGTTAHAVLDLNKQDGGNRKFILVEMEDYADTITAERVRRVINGVEAAKDENLKNGLGGSFTFCTLGQAFDIEKMLKGESLPDYTALANYVFYTATGKSLPSDAVQKPNWYVGETKNYQVYLIYKPDLNFLRSNESALGQNNLNLILEGNESKKQKLIFATAKFMGQESLNPHNIIFCQLPFAIHKLNMV